MKFNQLKTTFIQEFLPSVLNSYSIIFFVNNKLLAITLLAVTFLNIYAGLSGLLAVLLAVSLGFYMGFDKTLLKNGVYSFNALLTGIGIGTFFEYGTVFFSLLALATLLTLILSVAMGGWLFKYGLPFLSIPFVLTFWLVVLPASLYENLGLTQRNIFWINEMYSMGGHPLLKLFQTIESTELNQLLEIYLRSLSSIFFQDNLIAGILIALALLFSSRILFSLSIIGYLSAYFFARFSGSEAASITYYNIGANYMMVAFAIGGFFNIPSKTSYLWTILLIPLTSIILLFSIKLLGYIQLPAFSLPFAIITILFVYFLRQRTGNKGPVLTSIQQYSPEINLYTYENNKDRLQRFMYFPLNLPFWGEWTITQGHDGEFTHKDDWGKAYDFMILDSSGKSYKSDGYELSDYYCYGKPVIAPGDGIVELIINTIEDNKVGDINTTDNWGNSIIIRHLNGVYTQMSHLMKNSFKVSKGDTVKQGDIIASCGNSGRSPYPHLHYQVQSSANLGSKTLDYPFAYFYKIEQDKEILKQFSKPLELEKVSGINQNKFLYHALNFIPDTSLKFEYSINGNETKGEHWDVFTDAFNYKYLYSRETGAVAYFTCDNLMFYFTNFYGSKTSLLYHFYLSSYKVFLAQENKKITDKMPVYMLKNGKIIAALNDFVAPFKSFYRAEFKQETTLQDSNFDTTSIEYRSKNIVRYFKSKKEIANSTIHINRFGIEKFSFNSSKIKIEAKCVI